MKNIPQPPSLVDLLRWRVKQSSESVAFKFSSKETSYQDFDSTAKNPLSTEFLCPYVVDKVATQE